MDWNAAIERHRDALKGILAALVAMAGLGPREGALHQGVALAEKSNTPTP